MLDKIEMILSSECHLDKNRLYLVGVSGGPDSICLLHRLHHLGYHLVVLHVNHGLRPEADEEAQRVKSFVESFGLVFLTMRVDVLSYAEEQSLSIEEAARRLRYQSLFEQAENCGAAGVMVAHNADDQVETILMHLFRGSGLAGMRGMEYFSLPNPWSECIPLVRPLLSTWRVEIMAYLSEQKLSYINDQSNNDITFFRNRLRHELLPELESYNPRIRQNLLRMSQINQDDYSFLQQRTEEAWQMTFTKRGLNSLAFHLSRFKAYHPSIQRYLLRKAIAYFLPSLRDIDFETVERAIKFLGEPKLNGQVDLISGLQLMKEGELFWLATWQAELPGADFPAVPQGLGIVIKVPFTMPLNDGWVFQIIQESDPIQAIQQIYENVDPFQAWFDLDKVELPFILRGRKLGERIQPLGMQGHSVKISDLMVNLKIPKRARLTWPLVCSGKNILWVPGYRQSALASISCDSLKIAHLTLRRSSSA